MSVAKKRYDEAVASYRAAGVDLSKGLDQIPDDAIYQKAAARMGEILSALADLPHDSQESQTLAAEYAELDGSWLTFVPNKNPETLTEAESVARDKIAKDKADAAKAEKSALKAKLKDAVKNPPKKPEDIAALLATLAAQMDQLLGD